MYEKNRGLEDKVVEAQQTIKAQAAEITALQERAKAFEERAKKIEEFMEKYG